MLLLSLSLSGQPGWTQALAYNHQLPATRSASSPEMRRLRDVLQELKNHYQVDILFEGGLVDAVSVAANGIDYSQKLERNLDKILKTSHLHYKKIKDGAYLILDDTKDRKKASSRALSTSSEPVSGSIPAAANESGKPAGAVNSQPALKSVEQTVTGTISGKVIGTNKEPLAGATVVLKGTNKGASVDQSGNFTITNVDEGKHLLVASYIGFITEELTVTVPQTGELTIILGDDSKNLDEVVVTGVFDKRTRMESSVSISTLNTKQIDRIAINSAADLLKNIPGVFVNSSLGEIRNTVYSRGVSVGSNDGASGYYYVSLQEDGLPVTNATYDNYGPDFFLRADATLGKLEAVRGGTASILGNNAPGGIFNYVSKTGGQTLAGEVRAKFGLEGDGKNPFYRTDVNVGGPLNRDKTLTFNVGGFLRQSDGARYPGYPMNNGGQVKANLVKTYKSGSVKLFVKYLNDHNAWNEFLPTVSFTDPQLAPGVTQTTSVLIPAVQSDFTVNETGQKLHYDSRDKVHSVDKSIGLNWEQTIGIGWTIDSKFRYSDKSSIWNTTGVAYPYSLTSIPFYSTTATLGRLGIFSFNDFATGTQLGSITQAAGNAFTVNTSNFPGAAIQANSLLYNPLFYTNNQVKEAIEQFTITKKLTNMSFTGGLFYANSTVDRVASTGASGPGAVFSQLVSPRPLLTKISIAGADGNAYQLTNADGVIGGNGKSANVSIQQAAQTQTAFFFGHNWAINPKLNFDWGVRYETVKYGGTNQVGATTTSTTGGTDGNPLTLYDNRGGKIGATYSYADKKISTFSFSGGLNYKFTANQAVYARYSQGNKAPDLSGFISATTQFLADHLEPIAQNLQQLEIGYKMKAGKTTLYVTPFYSVLDNVPQSAIGQETADVSTTYRTPYLYNKYTTQGVEIEATHNITNQFSIRAVATFQSSTATIFKTWLLGANGAADDKTQDFSGNETDNNARSIIRISPSYSAGKFYASLDFSSMSKRVANVANAFSLPAYNQTNLNLAYSFSAKWQLQANINNIFNQNGIMGWSAPGGFPAALDRQGFTKAALEANPNAVYSTLSLPPRAYFLTATYKF